MFNPCKRIETNLRFYKHRLIFAFQSITLNALLQFAYTEISGARRQRKPHGL